MSYKKGQRLQLQSGNLLSNETVINVGCRDKFAHRFDDCAAMLSVVNRLVPIQFVAVFFTLVCFRSVCSCFILVHFSESKYMIQPVSFWLRGLLLPVAAFHFLLELVPGGD